MKKLLSKWVFWFLHDAGRSWQWPGTACVWPVKTRPGESYSPTKSSLLQAPPLLSASAMLRMSCYFSAPVTRAPAARHSGVPVAAEASLSFSGHVLILPG